MANGDPQGTHIGAALRDARRRQGLDIKQAEERTKIRARYIRALENEDWEVLPGPVYIRGFLRTYGQTLGLDGEALADRYRREYEEPAQPLAAGSESVLQHRRRLPDQRPSPWRPLALLAGLVGVVILAFAVLGGGDETADEPDGRTGQAERQTEKADGKGKGKGKKGGGASTPLRKENIKLKAITDVGTVCLVGSSKRALIDSQRLRSGLVERYKGAKRYRIDVERGSVEIRVADRTRRIDATDPVSYEADSRGIRETSYQGPDCP